MTLKDFVKCLKEFPPYTASENIYINNSLRTYFEKYVDIINKLDEVVFKDLNCQRSELISKVEEVNDIILKSIELYLKGNLIDAIDKIYYLFFQTQGCKKHIRISGNKFLIKGYRIRENHGDLFDKNNMYHIPFEKRELVSNQRYSINGYPCLYIGASIHNCWNELRKLPVDKLNCARIESHDKITLIKLLMPEADSAINKSSLCRIPLIIASSLRCYHDTNPFKIEYIIPQIIMHCIIKKGKVKLKGKNKSKIWGIQYLSTHIADMQITSARKFYNYVIPIQESAENGLCENLKQMFLISDPISSKDFFQYPCNPNTYLNGFNQLQKMLDKAPVYNLNSDNL